LHGIFYAGSNTFLIVLGPQLGQPSLSNSLHCEQRSSYVSTSVPHGQSPLNNVVLLVFPPTYPTDVTSWNAVHCGW
jgi:hypothetical protein